MTLEGDNPTRKRLSVRRRTFEAFGELGYLEFQIRVEPADLNERGRPTRLLLLEKQVLHLVALMLGALTE